MGGSITKKSGSGQAAELAARRAAEQRRQEALRRLAAERRQAEAQRAAAERARSAGTQNNAQKGLVTGKSNRAGDGFDTVSPGRTTRPVLTNAPAPGAVTRKPAATPADREFAALSAREGTRDTLAELGINDAAALARYAERLVRDAAKPDVEARSVDNQVAHAEIIRAAARTLPPGSEGATLLADDTFVNALASGAEPFEAATAVEAKALYDETLKPTVQKPLSQWSEHDAATFTDALADAVEANSDNPTLVNQLLALSQGRLERTAEIVGEATEANDFDGDTVEQLAANLSRVGNAAPDDGAATLAHALAGAIDDDSELNKVDDGFKHFVEDGGSGRFRAALNAALEAQGKGDAAEELREDGGGSSAGDRWGDVVSAVTDVVADQTHWALSGANAVYQAGGDALRGQLGRTLDVVDRGLAQVQEHGPSWAQGAAGVGRRGVELGRDGLAVHNRVQETLGGAVVAGGTGAVRAAGAAVADPTGTAEAVVDAALDLRDAAKIREQIASLGEHDEVKLSGKVGAAVLGIDGEISGDITVKVIDGQYRVRVDGTLGAGVDSTAGIDTGAASANASAEAQVQGGVAVEFTLGSAEDATTAVNTLLGGAAAAASLVTEGSLDGFNVDADLVRRSISAVEVHGGVAGEVLASAGVTVGPELRAQLSGSATARARVVFGDPAQLTIVGEQSVKASGRAQVGGGATASATVGGDALLRVSQTFDLHADIDAAAFLQDPKGVARSVAGRVVAKAETEVRLIIGADARAGVGVSATGNGNKGSGSASVGGGYETTIVLKGPTGEFADVVPELLDGDFSAAHRELSESSDVNVTVTTRERVRTEVGADVKAGDGADSVELGLTATRTDYTEVDERTGTYGEAATWVLEGFEQAREVVAG